MDLSDTMLQVDGPLMHFTLNIYTAGTMLLVCLFVRKTFNSLFDIQIIVIMCTIDICSNFLAQLN
jgi:hypothetical protein